MKGFSKSAWKNLGKRPTKGFFARNRNTGKSSPKTSAAAPPSVAAPASSPATAGLGDADMRIQERRDALEASGKLLSGNMQGKSFDDVNAEITRSQWNEFDKNDKPYILNYADEITSGKYTDRAVSQARDGVNQGFALTDATQQMRDSGMGVGLSAAQTADRTSDMARSKTASLIDAENNARLAATDRDNALLAGSHMPKTGN